MTMLRGGFKCAGENNLPKLETRQWAAALRNLKANASLERLDLERVVERMHAQVWFVTLCLHYM